MDENIGRPTIYSKEVAIEICAELATGKTLREICRVNTTYPHESTVRSWARDNVDGFYTHYARARDLGLDAMADELFDISDDGRNDWMEVRGYMVENREVTNRSKLRVDTRKWYLSKLAPKRYGEKIHNIIGGGEDGNEAVKVQIIDDLAD